MLNVPPLERLPYITSKGNATIALAHTAVTYWNAKLNSLALKFRTKHPDVTFSVYGTYNLFNRIMDNPQGYKQTAKVKNTTGYCKGYATYVFSIP
jgi:phospholipase/lecithinase/hemolysin